MKTNNKFYKGCNYSPLLFKHHNTMEPITVKAFNQLQNESYVEYCAKCKSNNVNPAPQSRYFPKVEVNYGYVVYNHLGHHTWKRRKRDFY